MPGAIIMPELSILPPPVLQSANLAVKAMSFTLSIGTILFILSVVVRPFVQAYLIRRFFRRVAPSLQNAPASTDASTMAGPDDLAPLDDNENETPQLALTELGALVPAFLHSPEMLEQLEIPSPGRRQAGTNEPGVNAVP